MTPLARSALTLGSHFLKALPGGISPAEGRQLFGDALVIAAALSPYAPAAVAPVLAVVFGWAGSAVASPPESVNAALASLLDAVLSATPGAEVPVAGTPRVRLTLADLQPVHIEAPEAAPLAEG